MGNPSRSESFIRSRTWECLAFWTQSYLWSCLEKVIKKSCLASWSQMTLCNDRDVMYTQQRVNMASKALSAPARHQDLLFKLWILFLSLCLMDSKHTTNIQSPFFLPNVHVKGEKSFWLFWELLSFNCQLEGEEIAMEPKEITKEGGRKRGMTSLNCKKEERDVNRYQIWLLRREGGS